MKKSFENQIIEHAKSHPKEEVCGALVFDKLGALRLVRLKNEHQDRENYFQINPREFLLLSKRYKILAIYHSHVDVSNKPSEYDLIKSKSIGLPFYIYSLLDEDFYLHIPDTYQPELYERVYVDDIMNCMMFVKHYYEQKFNFSWKYNGNWYELNDKKKVNDILIKGFVDSGFKEVPKGGLQEGDVIFFKSVVRDQYFHLGIYHNNGTFSHHHEGYLSKIDFMDEKYSRLVYKIYRYKGND